MKSIYWSYKKTTNHDLCLSIKDVNPLRRIYSDYNQEPESFEKCEIKYLLDKEKLSRYILKECDVLLNLNGILLISGTVNSIHNSCIRSLAQVKNEVSLSLGHRYKLISYEEKASTYFLKYVKVERINKTEDTINKWSFGIITNGKKLDSVNKLIDSIDLQKIPHYEILICGPLFNTNSHHVKFVDDINLEDDIRAPISRKKNAIISSMRFNNVMIMHDRYELPVNWFDSMKKYGNYFDALAMPNLDKFGNRVNDWTFFPSLPFQNRLQFNYLRSYSYWSNFWFIQGGLIIGKKEIFKKNPIPSQLHWGELEDVTFSQRLNLDGCFYYFDKNNFVITNSDRIGGVKAKSKFLFIISYVKNYLLFLYQSLIIFIKHKINILFS